MPVMMACGHPKLSVICISLFSFLDVLHPYLFAPLDSHCVADSRRFTSVGVHHYSLFVIFTPGSSCGRKLNS